MTTIKDLSFLNSTRPKDLYIVRNDKGEVSVCFASEKSLSVLQDHKHLLPYVKDGVINVIPQTINRWFVWALSHDLSFHSDLPFIVPQKNHL